MLLRSMPDLAPANQRFRAWFYTHWGRENCIILGSTRNAGYEPYRQRLSIKMASGGGERYFIDGRTVVVDDDCYLVLNDNRTYASLIDAAHSVESFSVFFRPGLMQDVLGAVCTSLHHSIDPAPARAVELPERLHPHDRTVTPVMRFIRHHIRAGVDDEQWYEEQLQVLAARVLVQHRRQHREALRLDCVKASTRAELSRRLALAADFIHSNHERDIGLIHMAQAACLSVHHFLRLFRTVYGLTPMQYLYRKRIAAALRLRERGMPMQDVAAQAGFNSRATFYRQWRRWAPALRASSLNH
jgi:AraC family transcriptional regulator